ncbi:MAG: hypothetical protein AAF799_27385 [Myxococcota bacterium]
MRRLWLTIGLGALGALVGCNGGAGDNPFDDPTTAAGATGDDPGPDTDGTPSGETGSAPSGDAQTSSEDETGPSDDDGSGILLDVGSPDTDGPPTKGGDGCAFIDVLFVVDISASMIQEKDNLAANFPDFVQVLDDYIADPSSNATGYRLGVTNSSVVDNGANQSTMGLDGELFDGTPFIGDCGTGGSPWLDGPSPSITANFNCLAPDPRSDCASCSDFGHERPLDVIEMFIEKAAPGGVNDGFYRGEDALLVVVLLTDEDDDAMFSTTTPGATKAALDAFVGGEERHVVVTIAGPEAGSCNSAFGSASAAPRLHEFTNASPNGLMGDICQGDLADPLADALALIQLSCDALPPPAG